MTSKLEINFFCYICSGHGACVLLLERVPSRARVPCTVYTSMKLSLYQVSSSPWQIEFNAHSIASRLDAIAPRQSTHCFAIVGSCISVYSRRANHDNWYFVWRGNDWRWWVGDLLAGYIYIFFIFFCCFFCCGNETTTKVKEWQTRKKGREIKIWMNFGMWFQSTGQFVIFPRSLSLRSFTRTNSSGSHAIWPTTKPNEYALINIQKFECKQKKLANQRRRKKKKKKRSPKPEILAKRVTHAMCSSLFRFWFCVEFELPNLSNIVSAFGVRVVDICCCSLTVPLGRTLLPGVSHVIDELINSNRFAATTFLIESNTPHGSLSLFAC